MRREQLGRAYEAVHPYKAVCVRSTVGLLFFGFAVAFAASNAIAVPVTLTHGGSIAEINTEPGDGPVLGHYDWVVDGTDHIQQQWFWTRTANDDIRENAVGTGDLVHDSSLVSTDVLISTYKDTVGADTYEVEVSYVLTGGTATSSLTEAIKIINTGDDPLQISFFQYADFNLSGLASGDTIVVTGTPKNRAEQSDTLLQVAETLVTEAPTHWMAGDAATILGLLEDSDADTLPDAATPYTGSDAAWAFQWDFEIAPSDSVIISKPKSLQVVPEPSSCLLALVALTSLLGLGRRKRR